MRNRAFISLAMMASCSGWVDAQQPLDTENSSRPELVQSVAAPAGQRRVESFKLEGDSHLTDEQLRAVLSGYEQRDLTLEEIKAAGRELTKAMQQQGFMLSRAVVPQQDFSTGVVTLKIVEAKVGEVTVEGAKHYDPEEIRRRVANANRDGVFNSADFQRALILLNEMPDLDVTATLRPGATAGTADVVLKVVDGSTFHAGLDYNNFGIPGAGENRAGLTLEAGSLISFGDKAYARGVLGFPSDRQTFFTAGYDCPVNDEGTTIGFQYANGAFTTGQNGVLLDVRGGADIYTLSAFHPVVRSLDHSLDVALAVSKKSIYNDLNFSAFGQVPSTREEYVSARLSFRSDWKRDDSRTFVQGALTQGLGGSAEIPSRFGATPTFTKFNLDAAQIQTLGEGFYGVVRGGGQFATGPLFIAEQFALGGPDSVRGFTQSEFLGDSGYTLSGELRWSPLEDKELLQLVGFIDHGHASLSRPLPGERSSQTFTGAGVGFRLGLNEHSNVRFDLGFPLSPSQNAHGRSPAIYTSVQTRF